jgi:hypothetical protein
VGPINAFGPNNWSYGINDICGDGCKELLFILCPNCKELGAIFFCIVVPKRNSINLNCELSKQASVVLTQSEPFFNFILARTNCILIRC